MNTSTRRFSKHYTDQVRSADDEIRRLFSKMVYQIKVATWINIAIHLITFIFAGYVLVRSTQLLLSSRSWGDQEKVGVGAILISLVVILIILFRNPLRIIKQSSVSTASLSFIYMHFVRLLSQKDMQFDRMIQNNEASDLAGFDELYGEMQVILEDALEQLRSVLDDFE